MSSGATGGLRIGDPRCWAAALFLPFFLALALPLEIYLSNAGEIMFPFNSLLPTLFAAFVGLLLVLGLPLFLPRPINSLYRRLLVAASLLAWVTASFVRGKYGLFNGEELDIDSTGTTALLELAGWLVVLALVAVSRKSGARLADLLVLILLLTFLVTGFRYVQALRDEHLQIKQQFLSITMEHMHREGFASLEEFSSEKNIVHLILDELQTQVFETLVKRQPELIGQLDGFTHFPDTSSLYPYTEMSLPGILSGKVYRNDSSREEYLVRAFRDNRFFDALDAQGYSRDFHITPGFCQDKYLDDCTPNPGLTVGPLGLSLLDFALFRAVPTALKKQVYGPSGGLFKRGFSSGDHHDSIVGLAFLVFSDFNENLAVLDIPPRYKFFQSMITHGPLYLDADCSILPQAQPNRLEPLLAQTRCAFTQVLDFLARLKALEIYDRTLIVISSDHGGNYHNPKIRRRLEALGIPPRHFSRAQAFLMVKPFDARGELETSRQRRSLADIAAIIGEEAGLGDMPQDMGRPADPDRLREYFSIYWGIVAPTKNDRLVDFIHYCMRGAVRNPATWGRMVRRDGGSYCERLAAVEPQ